MSAEVSSLFRTKRSCERGKSTAPITRDLLGGCANGSRGLDFDSQVPPGWEKRLDLQSGIVCLQRCNSNGNASKQSLSLFDETSLDLKLVSLSTLPSPSSSMTNYQSVCTLDKVKFALERAEREKPKKKRLTLMSNSSDSYSSDMTKEIEIDFEEKSSSLSFATGCPNCLLYVLISVENPKCPRCNTIIASSLATKKPRIDLNISI